MEIYTITKLAAEATTTALIHGTLLFFMIRGFINPRAKWFYVLIILLIVLQLFAFTIYPIDIFAHPIFPLFQAVCFIGGIFGAIKFYWRRRSKGNIDA